MAASEELIALEAAHNLYVQRLAAGFGNDAAPYIDKMQKQVHERINREVGKNLTPLRRESLIKDIKEIIKVNLTEYTRALSQDNAEFGKYEGDWQSKTVASVAAVETVTVTKAAINTAAKNSLIKLGEGSYTSYNEMLKYYSDNNARQITNIVAQGFQSGVSTRSIVGQVLDEVDNRVVKTRKEAKAIARTGTNHYANQARRVYFDAEPVVEQFILIATLDSSTSSICRSLDGKVFEKTETKYFPPLHYNCRSAASPYIPELGNEGERPENFRDAESGLLMPSVTDSKKVFYEAFKNLDAATQDQQLGPTLGKAFRKGLKDKTITPQSFAKMTVDEKNLRPLTLSDMMTKENALGRILRAQYK
jgi:SPP1 gp7 family putative phage head morphogenesis protein